MAGITVHWLRHIENGQKPSQDVKDAIRSALKICPIHSAFGVKCTHELPVPPDEELYEPSQR